MHFHSLIQSATIIPCLFNAFMIKFKLISITYKCLPGLISACLYGHIFWYSFIYLLCSNHKFCVHYNLVSCLKVGISLYPFFREYSFLPYSGKLKLTYSEKLILTHHNFQTVRDPSLCINLSYQLSNCMLIINLLISTMNSLTCLHHSHFFTQWLAL